jgi:sterol desaturase/sphingolipid hydroxylase (fatty acid hydroxylase superfamily)
MTITDEQTVRLTCFLATLMAIGVWEHLAPCRVLNDNKPRRWFTNLSLVALNAGVVRLAVPILPVGLSLMLRERGCGILAVVTWPDWIEIVLALLMLDFVIYLQHLLFHFMPTLWRFHRMHHTDLDIDVSTGNRFHPLEIVISTGIKLAAVWLIGPPVVAVVAFEIVLNASAQFNHGNIRMPTVIDRWLRLFVVTPDMHRVHHSVLVRETNSNFGFNVPWWDHLFGTYRAQPEKGHLAMSIGLTEYRNPADLTLGRLLVQPFIKRP